MRHAVPPGGRSLPGDVRALMESRFNADFSRVTVHEGPPAKEYTATRDANAYAVGEHIVFDQGRYAPHSAQGQKLLAHELAHVVQQRRGGALPSAADEPVLEMQADRAAEAFQKGDAAGVGVEVGGASGAGVMCDRNGRKRKRPGSDYDDDEQFDADEDTEQARRKSERERTLQEKSDRRNAGKSHAQIGSDEAERELRKMEDHARAPGGNQRSHKRRNRKLKSFERKLEAARGTQLDKNKRKGDFDERQGTPGGVGVTPQTDYVAGGKVLPGQQVRDEDDNSIAHHTRPDFSATRRRKDGTWERVHVNLKSNQIDRMTEGEARGAAREILYQAVKNKAHLPGEERLIISFSHTPSKELQEAIKEELFREHTPISEIRFGNVVHRNADYKPENGRIPLDVNAKDRRKRLAAEAKREKKKQDAEKKAAKKATKKATKKAPVKKASKKAAKKAVKKATKKTPAKKAAKKAAKKTTKKVAKKAPAKKAIKKTTKKTAKKAPVAKKETKNTATKKAVKKAAKKTSSKTAIEKESEKKPVAKKAEKKSSAKKPAEKKSEKPSTSRKKAGATKKSASAQSTAGQQAHETQSDDAHTVEKARAPRARKASPVQPKPAAKAAPAQQQPQQSAAKKPTAPAPAKPPAKPPTQPPAKVQPPSPIQTKPGPKPQAAPPVPAKPQNAPKNPPAASQPPAAKKTAPAQAPQKKATNPAKPPGAGGKGMGTAGSAQRQTFFNDQVQVSVQEQLGAAKPFRVTTAITLRGGGSFGGQASKGSSGASGNLSASGSLSISYSKWMTAQEKNQYLESVSSGHGAGHAESTIIELIASKQQDAAAEAIKKAKAKMGDRQQGEAGDTEEISVEGDVSAGAGASRGGSRGVGGHVEISSGKGIRRTRTLMEDGKELYTVTVTLRSGQSLGGTLQYGAVGGGHTDTRDETRTVYFSFLLDPENTAEYTARKNEILAATSAEELNDLANKHRHLAYGRGQSKAEGKTGTTSFSVFGIGVDVDQSSFYEEGESEDPNGKMRHVRGGAGIGGSGTFLGRRFNPSGTTDSFTGWVDENNVGGGVTQTENREIDWQKTAGGLADAASHPIESAIAVAKGKPVLKDRVDTVGVNLTDDSFTVIANMAKNERDWFSAWTGKGVSRGSKDDWEATRQLVLAADGDRAKIQQAMAKWEKGDSGRSAEVEKLTGNTGVSFDFPDEIIDQKPVYDQLVMNDVLAEPRQLVAEGKTSEAVSRLHELNRRAGELLQTVQMHSGKATDPGKFSTVQNNIAARQKQMRQEIYRLTSPSAKAAAKAGEPPPEPVAAPPPDFVGPLSVDQEEAVKAERKEASETIHTKVGICLVNRDIENKAFAAVVDELDDFYVSHSFIFEKLNSLKPMYAKWDEAIAELKAAYPKIGDPPDRANQFAPNRDRWNDLNKQGLK